MALLQRSDPTRLTALDGLDGTTDAVIAQMTRVLAEVDKAATGD